ncbi:MAG TPA: hypothetical protein VKB92_10230 [Myxococcales bacterium]|nr:hypothetical protein [Myxococcales bacterium]
MVHPLAGKPAPRELLVDLELLRRRYFEKPDPADPQQAIVNEARQIVADALRGA